MSKISRRPNPGLDLTLHPPVRSFILPMVSYGVYGPVTMWKTGVWSLMSGTISTPNPTKLRQHQEDPLCHGDPECAPSWTINEVFGNMIGL